MQIVYRTNDSARADEIHEFLERCGIPAAVHGAGLHSQMRTRAADAVSVWVVQDADLPRAEKLLAELFSREAAGAGAVYPPPPVNRRLRFVLLMLGAFIATLLALLAASS